MRKHRTRSATIVSELLQGEQTCSQPGKLDSDKQLTQAKENTTIDTAGENTPVLI
jgi:hypothetical protein